MSAIRRSVIASVADKYASQIISVVTLAAMSRILTPSEIGLYLLASTVILLVENLRIFGTGIFIVQEKTLERETVRTAFTITLLISLGLALGIYLSADLISAFFREPGLRHLLVVATLAFVIAPFGNPILALLQRDLSFSVLAVLNVTVAIVNAVVTIGLATWGFGPVSYVWGIVASGLVLVIGAICVRPEFWVFRPSLHNARRILSFGAISSSITVLNQAYELLPRMALGRILGVDAVGIYARAVTVCQLPDRALVSALQPVVLPAMAMQSRMGGNLKTSYLRGHTLMSAIQWPTLMMLALLANPVVAILLGAQWTETPPLVRIIAIATMTMAPAFMTFPVLVSVGKIRDALWSSLICLPPSILAVIVAANISLTAVAASLLIIAPLQMFVALLFIRRAISMTWTELAIASQRSILLTVGTALVPSMIILFSPHGFDLSMVETSFAIAGGGIGWLVAVVLTDHPIKLEVLAVWHILAGFRHRNTETAKTITD